MNQGGLMICSTHRTPRVLAEVLPGPAAFCVWIVTLRQLRTAAN